MLVTNAENKFRDRKEKGEHSLIIKMSLIILTEKDKKSFEETMKFFPGNKLAFGILHDAITNGEKVMPFVGAGISAFAYKTWNELLRYLAEYLEVKDMMNVKILLDDGKYMEAAQYICSSMGQTLFDKSLRSLYSEDKINDDDLKKNAAFYIPLICGGNCITTNYDRVIEHACMLNSVAYDMAGINDTYKLNTYFRNPNKRGLIFKLHGDILSNNNDILLSEKSYNTHYQLGSPLRKHLEKWIGGRQFLFIGASLLKDKTINVLVDELEEGMLNYVIYGCSGSEIHKLKQWFDEMGMIPIFYDSKDHSSLTSILKYLVYDK